MAKKKEKNTQKQAQRLSTLEKLKAYRQQVAIKANAQREYFASESDNDELIEGMKERNAAFTKSLIKLFVLFGLLVILYVLMK